MRVLLDTHAVLWATLEPARLSPTARRLLIDPGNETVVSSVVAWEVATKYRLGKLPGVAAFLGNFRQHMARLKAEELPVTSQHALLAGSFTTRHRDPFDRMLAAQAVIEGLPLLTNDRAMLDFEIITLW